ncbi:hypothetical protein EW145_g1772 [Phellinidium pouzarii]|uniref:Major facilitator superfamily (MFS) profile domain-containing protein n=1 Tax=Phellinidium pouzarii TaxID=167371 RepID=A0A4S4LIR1_9AGAM|nr:hypothetical protein EW145_g1772 [Phellinidium pouzarii]
MAAGAVAVVGETAGYAHLVDPTRKWYNNWRIFSLNGWIVLLLITSSNFGYDGSMMNGLQSLPQWESSFNTPQGSSLGLLNAIQSIGSLAAYPFVPYLADGIGRRPTIFFGAVIMCGAVALQTASSSVHMFIGARFLIGFGLTFPQNAAPMLITEVAYPPHRAQLTSLYMCLWYSGSIVAAWSTYGSFRIKNSWAWRLPSLLQGIPAFLQIFLVLFAPESPRWLVSKNRETQALSTLAYYHADGNEQDPLVQYEYQEIRAAYELDRTIATNVGWKSLYKTPGNRRRMRIIIALAVFSQWSGNGLVSSYLSKVFNAIGITDSLTQLLINGILQIWNLAVSMSSAFLVERIGRRILFIASCIGMLVFFTTQTVCSAVFAKTQNESAAHSVIAFIFLFSAAYDIAFTPLIVSYTVEILPYNIRSKGLDVSNFIASIAIIFNQYINPIALEHIAWRYYIVYCCWLVVELGFCWLYVVETKGLSLEETAALFDGEDAVEQIATMKVGDDMHEDHDNEKKSDSVHSTS